MWVRVRNKEINNMFAVVVVAVEVMVLAVVAVVVAVLVEGSEGRTSFYWRTYPGWPPPILTVTAHRVRPIRKGRSARWCRYGEEWRVFNTVFSVLEWRRVESVQYRILCKWRRVESVQYRILCVLLEYL